MDSIVKCCRTCACRDSGYSCGTCDEFDEWTYATPDKVMRKRNAETLRKLVDMFNRVKHNTSLPAEVREAFVAEIMEAVATLMGLDD